MHVKKNFEKIYVLSATGSSFYLYSFTNIIFDIAKKEGLFCLKVLRHPPPPPSSNVMSYYSYYYVINAARWGKY